MWDHGYIHKENMNKPKSHSCSQLPFSACIHEIETATSWRNPQLPWPQEVLRLRPIWNIETYTNKRRKLSATNPISSVHLKHQSTHLKNHLFLSEVSEYIIISNCRLRCGRRICYGSIWPLLKEGICYVGFAIASNSELNMTTFSAETLPMDEVPELPVSDGGDAGGFLLAA